MSVKKEANGRRSVQIEIEVPGTPDLPGGDLSLLAASLLQPWHPRLADAIFRGHDPRPHACVAVRQHPNPQIHRVSTHCSPSLDNCLSYPICEFDARSGRKAL
jgi:hypothetical protein